MLSDLGLSSIASVLLIALHIICLNTVHMQSVRVPFLWSWNWLSLQLDISWTFLGAMLLRAIIPLVRSPIGNRWKAWGKKRRLWVQLPCLASGRSFTSTSGRTFLGFWGRIRALSQSIPHSMYVSICDIAVKSCECIFLSLGGVRWGYGEDYQLALEMFWQTIHCLRGGKHCFVNADYSAGVGMWPQLRIFFMVKGIYQGAL